MWRPEDSLGYCSSGAGLFFFAPVGRLASLSVSLRDLSPFPLLFMWVLGMELGASYSKANTLLI